MMSEPTPSSQKDECPSCGRPLRQVAGSNAQLCRSCVMQGVMGASPTGLGRVDEDNYDIHKEIGRGGSGTVYLATDRKVGRQVAVKLLNNLQGLDEVSEQRFRAEAEATAALDHPNIISIYDNGELDGRPFFTMKYVDGGSLATRGIDFSDPTLAAALLEKIAGAVHHAHQRGILHRDLKPSNILLDKEGEPYVSDFGIAKREGDDRHLTLTGAVMGTPNYMSPEQALGDNLQLTTATDIFSLGAIFFELLSRRQAFEGKTSHSVIRNVLDSEVTFTRAELENIDRDLASICLKCLEKDPARRYSSARAFAEDLARWRQGDTIEARHITGGERAWRWMRRRPVLVASIALAVTSMVAGTVVSTLQARRAEAARNIAEETAYFASIGSALSARERYDFGEALRHLAICPPEKRNRFEWRLVNALSRGNHVWRTEFGAGFPIDLTYDDSTEQVVVLTKDRRLHHLDRWSGEIRKHGMLPGTGSSGDYLSLREFRFAPGGRHYFFIDGDTLYIVDHASASIIHQVDTPPEAAAVWLSKDRVLYLRGPVPEGAPLPPETAWTYELLSNRTTALSDKRWTAPVTVSTDGTKIALVRMDTKVVVFPTDADFIGNPEFRLRGTPPYKELAFSGDMKNIAVHSGINESWLQVFEMETEERVFEEFWPAPSQISLTSGEHDVIITDQESWFSRCRAVGKKTRLKVLQSPVRHEAPRLRQDDGPIAPPPRSFEGNLTGSRKKFILAHAAPLVDFQILPGQGDFYTASRDGSVRYWRSNIPAAFPLRLDGHGATENSHHPLASRNGEHVTLRDNIDGLPARWSRHTAGVFLSHDGGEALAALDDGRTFTRSADGSRITCLQQTGDSDSLLELWHITIPSHPDATFIRSSTTPDERYIASLFTDHILLLDVANRVVHELESPDNASNDSHGSITISPDGHRIAVTGFHDYITHLYSGSTVHELSSDPSLRSRVSTCCFSHDGKRLYVGSLDGWVRVFDPHTFAEARDEAWSAHSHSITAIAITQSGDIIATAGGTSVALWSTAFEPGEPHQFRIQLNTGPGARDWLQFCANDTLLLHTAQDRPIEVLEAPISGN